jgi:hypothetical protein
MNQQLHDAITNKTALKVRYKDVERWIEPVAYGVSKKGSEILRAYQMHGDSDSGPGWKLFTVAGLSDIEPSGQPFTGPQAGYAKGDKAMASIFAEL